MLRKTALHKIFTTTLTMLIVLSIYTIPATIESNSKVIRTNLEIEDITGLKANKIYLENKNHYLVKVDVFLGSNNIKDQIIKILEYLKINNSKIPKGLNGYIKENVKLKELKIDEKTITLDFQENFIEKDIKKEEKIITGIVYSILELDDSFKVTIKVNGKDYKNYKNLTKKIGINKEYILNNRQDINKVVIYYIDEIDDKYYYVPVTEYLNDNRNKIEIIIEELSKSNNNSLISMVDENIELLSYKEEANVLFLNFNKKLMNENKESQTKTLESIAYSVFENYDVNMVLFEVEEKEIDYILK